jgi:tetratricopeptide (TPR) repeat protein
MVVILIVALAALLTQHPETLSLLGDPLYPPRLPKAERAKAEAALAVARAAYDKQPSNPATIIGFEQANLALGRVGDALEILTHGLEVNQDDPRLLLERGRSYIRIRKFQPAERDLRKAAALPAAKCALAFTLYLSADFAQARQSYAACSNPGVFGYLAERRSGTSPATRPTPGGAVSSAPPPIRFPGTVSSGRQNAGPPQPLEASYLEAIERLLDGNTDDAVERLKKIVEKNRRNDWMEPAYIAAEADYARLKKPERGKKRGDSRP